MIKIVTIIGARPQFIKAAAISRAIQTSFSKKITEILVHTGQHYDSNMSSIFFEEMGIPKENYNLQVGSGSHAAQTASMINGIEEILIKENPACVVLYGDTNSTLAGAVAAAKLLIPIIHIEAGLRSFNKSMPEEINRIVCDQCATLLFSPTKTGIDNLIDEGFNTWNEKSNLKPSADHPRIYHCGDVMYDNALYFSQIAEKKPGILKKYNLETGNYILATIHRNNNTDSPERINAIFNALNKFSVENNIKIVLPMHPRTGKILESNLDTTLLSAIRSNTNFLLIPPASFFEMMVLEKNCKLICTDSGGVQKEAFFFQKPCIILRSETEWIELVECGTAILVDADEIRILQAFSDFKSKSGMTFPSLFGDGRAADFICQEIIDTFS